MLVRPDNLVLQAPCDMAAQEQVLGLDTYLELIVSFLATSWSSFNRASKACHAAASAQATQALRARFSGATTFGPPLCVHRYLCPAAETVHYSSRQAWIGRTVEIARRGTRVLLHHTLVRDRGLSFADAERMLAAASTTHRVVDRHEGFYRTRRFTAGWDDRSSYALLVRDGGWGHRGEEDDGGTSDASEDSNATLADNLEGVYRLWRPGSGMGRALTQVGEVLEAFLPVSAEEAAADWTRWHDELRTRCIHGGDDERCAGPCCTIGKRILEEDMLAGDFMYFWPEFASAARLSSRGFDRYFGDNDPRASRAHSFGKVNYRRPRIVTLDAVDNANANDSGSGSTRALAGVRVTSGELRRLRAATHVRTTHQSLSLSLADRMRGLLV